MFCTNCGAENQEQARYCFKCGDRIRVPNGTKNSVPPTGYSAPEAAELPSTVAGSESISASATNGPSTANSQLSEAPADAGRAVPGFDTGSRQPDDPISVNAFFSSWRATSITSRALGAGVALVLIFSVANMVRKAAHPKDPDHRTPTTLSLAASLGEKEAEALRQPVFKVLREREPRAYESLERAARVSMASGSTASALSELNSRMAQVLQEVLKRRVAYASDDALVAYFRYIRAQEEALQKQSADLCFGYEFPDTLPGGHRYYGPVPEWEGVLTQVLLTVDASRAIPSDAEVAPVLTKVKATLQRSLGPIAKLLEDMNDPTKRSTMNKGDGCRVLIGFYSSILQLPRQDAVPFMRFLMFHATPPGVAEPLPRGGTP